MEKVFVLKGNLRESVLYVCLILMECVVEEQSKTNAKHGVNILK